MAEQPPLRSSWPCSLLVLFVCTRVPSQASLDNCYCVLDHLQQCEDLEDLRQAGLHFLRSDLTPGGGVSLLPCDNRVPQLLYNHQHPFGRNAMRFACLRGMQSSPSACTPSVCDSLTRVAVLGQSNRSASPMGDDEARGPTKPPSNGHPSQLDP